MSRRLVYLYDSTAELRGGADLQEALALLDELKAKGLRVEVLDTKDTPDEELDTYRLWAAAVALEGHFLTRQVFGTRRHGGAPFLGRQVPALFVFEGGRETPRAVYPHEHGGELVSVEAILRDFACAPPEPDC